MPGYGIGHANIHTRNQIVKMDRRQKLLARKQAMGRTASYRTLSRMTGDSTTTLRKVLQYLPSPIPINRDEIMNRIQRALDALEEEEDQPEMLAA